MSDTVENVLENVLENVQESVDESVNDEMVVEEVQPVEEEDDGEDDESDVPSEEEAPVEEASVPQPVPEPEPEPEPMIENNNLCSLKTIVDALGKWSGGEIKRGQVEDLLKEGTDADENLDDLEKVVEILKLWIDEGGSTFREHNHFKNIDEYTLLGESRNLSEEEKLVILKTLTDLTIDVSQRKKTDEEIKNIINNL